VPGDIERYIARRRAAGMSEASCNRELTFLRCVYRRAMKDGIAASSPVLPEHFFKEANQRVRYLTEEEESTLRREIGERDWPKVAVALHTGFRQANEFRLRWTDVNFARGFVSAHHTKSGEDYHVPMNDELRAVLRALPSRLTSPWVFPSETGETPLDPKNFINRVFSPALERAGIRLPVARPAAHLRVSAGHARGRHPDRSGAHGPQDASDDPALFASLSCPQARRRSASDGHRRWTRNRHRYRHQRQRTKGGKGRQPASH
jgi:site-specific recombinase XerD